MDVPCLQSAVTCDPGKQDWGKRYIDVDLSEQHARLYDDNGSIIWEADVVTGILMVITIHLKAFGILPAIFVVHDFLDPMMNPDVRLGYQVDFWLGVKGQEAGFHNAPWRSAFGGQIYKTGGSHGCINLSYDDAENFLISQRRRPVVIHY